MAAQPNKIAPGCWRLHSLGPAQDAGHDCRDCQTGLLARDCQDPLGLGRKQDLRGSPKATRCRHPSLDHPWQTRKQMYKGEANWEHIAAVKNHPSIHMPIFGNGGINSPPQALAYKNKYGVEGLRIGRASIGYPWLFQEIKHLRQIGAELPLPDLHGRIATVNKHLAHALAWKGERTSLLAIEKLLHPLFKGLASISLQVVAGHCPIPAEKWMTFWKRFLVPLRTDLSRICSKQLHTSMVLPGAYSSCWA